MKLINLILIGFLLFVTGINAQDFFSGTIMNDVFSATENIFPVSDLMPRGGQEKTASGTLRTLVIFVRYKDDVQNTPTWPDYNVLPAWAQTFVDPTIPSNKIYTSKNLSDFFDRSSGGDGSGTLGTFHMVGDVVYVTTQNNKSAYSDESDIFREVLNTLDNSLGTYNIDFSLYDNWEFTKDNIAYNHIYKPG